MSVEIAFPIEFVVEGTPIPLVHAVKLRTPPKRTRPGASTAKRQFSRLFPRLTVRYGLVRFEKLNARTLARRTPYTDVAEQVPLSVSRMRAAVR
jgi:hypothetical protein